LREAVARTEAFIAVLPRDEASLLSQLSASLALLLFARGISVRAGETATNACALARTSGDVPTLADALLVFAFTHIDLGNFASAEAALNEAAAMPLLSAPQRIDLTHMQARLAHLTGDLDAAAVAYEQLIAQQRTLGNVRNAHVGIANLADIEHARGQTARAIALVRQTLPALRSGSDPALRSNMLGNLAAYLAASDDVSAAIEAAREAIATLATEPDEQVVTMSLEHLALAYALEGRWELAAGLASYCAAAVARLGCKRQFTEQTTRDRLTALLDANLVPGERARLAVEGAALTPEAAVALALEKR
jgi:tetratricopeptide (TPR) repeat protein